MITSYFHLFPPSQFSLLQLIYSDCASPFDVFLLHLQDLLRLEAVKVLLDS